MCKTEGVFTERLFSFCFSASESASRCINPSTLRHWASLPPKVTSSRNACYGTTRSRPGGVKRLRTTNVWLQSFTVRKSPIKLYRSTERFFIKNRLEATINSNPAPQLDTSPKRSVIVCRADLIRDIDQFRLALRVPFEQPLYPTAEELIHTVCLKCASSAYAAASANTCLPLRYQTCWQGRLTFIPYRLEPRTLFVLPLDTIFV